MYKRDENFERKNENEIINYLIYLHYKINMDKVLSLTENQPTSTLERHLTRCNCVYTIFHSKQNEIFLSTLGLLIL